jgi:hypothetical protein
VYVSNALFTLLHWCLCFVVCFVFGRWAIFPTCRIYFLRCFSNVPLSESQGYVCPVITYSVFKPPKRAISLFVSFHFPLGLGGGGGIIGLFEMEVKLTYEWASGLSFIYYNFHVLHIRYYLRPLPSHTSHTSTTTNPRFFLWPGATQSSDKQKRRRRGMSRRG